MDNVKLSSPWVVYFRKLQALFGEDPEVNVVYDEDAEVIRLLVDNNYKAEALSCLLPTEKTFGNKVVKISVVPANSENSKIALLNTAFAGNPALSFIASATELSNPIHYVVFAKEVVQYFTDNLGDYHGVNSTLYQDLAKEILGEGEGIFYCTDVE